MEKNLRLSLPLPLSTFLSPSSYLSLLPPPSPSRFKANSTQHPVFVTLPRSPSLSLFLYPLIPLLFLNYHAKAREYRKTISIIPQWIVFAHKKSATSERNSPPLGS